MFPTIIKRKIQENEPKVAESIKKPKLSPKDVLQCDVPNCSKHYTRTDKSNHMKRWHPNLIPAKYCASIACKNIVNHQLYSFCIGCILYFTLNQVKMCVGDECKEIKPFSEFNKSGNTLCGLDRLCRKCNANRSKKYKKTHSGFINKLLSVASRREIKCTLTKQDLLDLYDQQEGRCYYSGVNLSYHAPFLMSLERLSPEGIYEKGNVALICFELNAPLTWNLCKRIKLITMHEAKEIPNQTTKLLENNVKSIQNSGMERDKVDFTNIIHVLRYKFGLSQSRSDERNRNGKNHEFNITVQYLLDLFVEQKGCCAISGIPFPMSGEEFVISIDRIDDKIGYIKENVRLVFTELNVTAKLTTEIFNQIVAGIKSVLSKIDK